jgi:hypothetical protein
VVYRFFEYALNALCNTAGLRENKLEGERGDFKNIFNHQARGFTIDYEKH